MLVIVYMNVMNFAAFSFDIPLAILIIEFMI